MLDWLLEDVDGCANVAIDFCGFFFHYQFSKCCLSYCSWLIKGTLIDLLSFLSLRLWPPLSKGRKSYDFRLILRPLTDYVCDRFTNLVGMFFLPFPIYDLWLWRLLCAINLPGRRIYQINSYTMYSFKQNIKYSYFIGL